jgi:hypothetical protein
MISSKLSASTPPIVSEYVKLTVRVGPPTNCCSTRSITSCATRPVA